MKLLFAFALLSIMSLVRADGLTYYDLRTSQPSLVYTQKLSVPKEFNVLQSFLDRNKLELQAFAGIDTDSSTGSPLKTGFDVGRRFPFKDENMCVFIAAAVEVRSNRAVGAGFIFGLGFKS